MNIEDLLRAVQEGAFEMKTAHGRLMTQLEALETQRNGLHAVLSVLACQTGTVATWAETMLQAVNLDPMDQLALHAALTAVDMDVPAELTLGDAAPIPVAASEAPERLIGRLQMAKVVLGWLEETPRRKRRPMAIELRRMVAELDAKV